ncbi:MAG: NAD-dependent epimerase/dehydratase family protein [Schleiferiaceae bacterium]|nr:NAD-dependent epimerase/dehydratase family protein [Schleiferiaceae bacterium]
MKEPEVHTVTGATGLLGSHLVAELVAAGYTVRVLYRREARLRRLNRVLGYYFDDPDAVQKKLEKVQADLLDPEDLKKALPGTTVLYHCAARVSFARQDRTKLLQENPAMTAALVNEALAQGVQKLVHISSVAALGRRRGQQHSDENSRWVPGRSNTAYARSKYKAELEAWRGSEEGLPTVILNPSIILGPGFWEEGSGKFFGQIAGGFPFYSTGVNGFVDVRDVARSARLLGQGSYREARYLVAGHNASYQAVFTGIAQALGVRAPRIRVRPWLAALVWRAEALRSLLTGAEPSVTRETARTALQVHYYHSDKLLATLPDFQFRPLEDTLRHTARCYQADHST